LQAPSASAQTLLSNGMWSHCRFPSMDAFLGGWCGMFSPGGSVTSNEWAVGLMGTFEGVTTPSPYTWHWWVRGWGDSCWRWTWFPYTEHWEFYYLNPQTGSWQYEGFSTSRFLNVKVFGRIQCWRFGGWYESELEYYTGWQLPPIGGPAWTDVSSLPFLFQNFGCPPPPPPPTPTPTRTPTPTPTPTRTPTLPPNVTPTPDPRATATPTPAARPTAAPVPIAPVGCVLASEPTFSWSAVPGASHYEFYLLKDNPGSGTDTVDHRPIVNGTSYRVPEELMVRGVTYRWKVRAVNSIGDGPYSGPGGDGTNFTPGCPPATTAPGGCINTLLPTFVWGSVPGATSYRLFVAAWVPDPDTGQTTVLNVSTPHQNFPLTTKLRRGRSYYWKVKASNASDEGAYSPLVNFNTNCVPPPAVDEDFTDVRPPEVDQGPDGAPASVGCPVSVTNGNMFLDQADLSVGGIGPVLGFGRSYNSDNIVAGRYGIFGPGWTHPYEVNVRPDTDETLLLTAGDGTPVYFWDSDGDRRYDAYVPATEQSWFIREGDGRFTRHFRAGGTETYDAQGRLLQVTDLLGRSLIIQRNEAGRIERVTNASQRWLAFTYDGARLAEVADGAGLTRTTYGYDANGRLAGVTYADGSGFTFAYSSSNRLQTVTDRTGRVVETHEYYPDGRARTSALADGRELLTLVYGTNQTTVTDALGHVTTYDFVAINKTRRVVKITGPCTSCGGGGGDVQEWTYDAQGRVKTTKDAGGKITHYEYDPETGDLTLTKDALLNTTIYTYHPDGRVKTITTPDNATKRYTYIAAGPETITESIDANRWRTTQILYNVMGQPATTFDYRGNQTKYAYFATTHDLESVTRPAGVTRFVYDELGRVRETRDPLDRLTKVEYDGRGRTRKVIYPDGTSSEVSYDLAGRRAVAKDALGRESRSVYDQYGRVVESVDPLRNVTRRAYDLMSRPLSITDAEGRTTSFERDPQGRVVRTVYPGGAVESTSYDKEGRLASRTDRTGIRTTYRYDALGRLSGKSYSDNSSGVSYTYDVMHRMSTASNAVDTLSWTYDHLSRVLTESSSRHGSTVSYTYDEDGNRLTLALNGTPVVTYSYDEAARLDWLRHDGQTYDFAYDAASRRTSMSYPNGVTTTYSLNAMDRLLQLSAVKGAQAVTSAAYEYDAVGNRTRKTMPEFSEDYGYDALSRLTRVQRGSAQQWGFDYDRVGNRVNDRWNGTVMQASHNERNELLSKQVGGPVPVDGQLSEAGTVQVNGQTARSYAGTRFAGQITATPGSNTFGVQATDASGNTVTKQYTYEVSGQPATMVYDVNGNLTSKTEGAAVWTYEWSVTNQLRRVLKDGSEVARFAYDPLGRRVEKVAGGMTYSWLYDGQDVLRETVTSTSGTQTSLYIHGPGVDEPLAKKDVATGAMTYYHADGLGSIVKHTDDAGNVVHTYQYDAWGNIEVGVSRSGHAYTGRESDSETSLYYYRARYYDPRLGRFISEDPARDGLNLYGYVGNSPVSFSDPLGLERWDQWDRQPTVRVVPISTAQQVVGYALLLGGPFTIVAKAPGAPPSEPGSWGAWMDGVLAGQRASGPVFACSVSNGGIAARHGNPVHNSIIDRVAARMRALGWRDVRKNQQQVDAAGNFFPNRPDLSGINPKTGQRVNLEWDTNPAGSARHRAVVPANDPGAVNIFMVIDPATGRVISSVR
jgi:RHS repeat-associated protein